jgi:hypothetical protein
VKFVGRTKPPLPLTPLRGIAVRRGSATGRSEATGGRGNAGRREEVRRREEEGAFNGGRRSSTGAHSWRRRRRHVAVGLCAAPREPAAQRKRRPTAVASS